MHTILACFLLFIFIVILSVFIVRRDVAAENESFTVKFSDYKVPNPGYCKPEINNQDFASGAYNSYCWDKMGDEDCGLLNRNGYNCGKNLKNGKNMDCIYTTGTCRDDPSCFSTCYDRVGKFNEPYMIQVESDNLIGLQATV
jgi:uncharacterized protein YxeA